MNTIENKDHRSDSNLIKHLKDPDFFDVKKFPFSTIVINNVELTNDEHKKVTGNLTIKSITHLVTFPAKMNVEGGIVKENGKLVPIDIVTSYGPHLMVRNIKQDRNGNILIAGSNSSVFGDVFRYDGKSFTNLTSKAGSHRFWDVLEDRRGNLWFASLDSGVYYYNGKSFQHFTTREGLANNMVMSIYKDKASNIWFGGGGLSR